MILRVRVFLKFIYRQNKVLPILLAAWAGQGTVANDHEPDTIGGSVGG
ncbi:MAG: hypothetical protein R3A45_12525 [Bdellovibrionota bacterium]